MKNWNNLSSKQKKSGKVTTLGFVSGIAIGVVAYELLNSIVTRRIKDELKSERKAKEE